MAPEVTVSRADLETRSLREFETFFEFWLTTHFDSEISKAILPPLFFSFALRGTQRRGRGAPVWLAETKIGPGPGKAGLPLPVRRNIYRRHLQAKLKGMESGTVRGNGRQIDFEMAAGGDTGPSEGEKDRVRGHADNERGLARREPRKYMVPTGCRGTRHLTIIQITFGRRGRGRDPFGNRLESRLTILSPSRVPSIRPRFFSRRVEEERSPPVRFPHLFAQLRDVDPAISTIYRPTTAVGRVVYPAACRLILYMGCKNYRR